MSARYWRVLFAVGVGLLFAMQAITLLFDIYNNFLDPPPFHFSSPTYHPKRTDLCPGEVLEWADTRIVTVNNVAVAIYQSLWDIDERHTVAPGGEPETYIWLHPATITNERAYTVPNVPPGLYELRVASPHERGAEVYAVPFAVRDCGDLVSPGRIEP